MCCPHGHRCLLVPCIAAAGKLGAKHRDDGRGHLASVEPDHVRLVDEK